MLTEICATNFYCPSLKLFINTLKYTGGLVVSFIVSLETSTFRAEIIKIDSHIMRWSEGGKGPS